MSETQYPFEVSAPDSQSAGSFVATIRVPIPEGVKPADVIKYTRSSQLKEDFMNSWVKDNAAGYGMSVRGGPMAMHEEKGKRSSPVIAYEQEFKLTRPI